MPPLESPRAPSPSPSPRSRRSIVPPAPPPASIFAGGRARQPTFQQQIDAVPPASLRAREVNSLPRLSIPDAPFKGHYILEAWLHTSRERRSWIIRHGVVVVKIDADSASGTGGTYWLCSHCDRRRKYSLYTIAATSSAGRHLGAAHRISEQGSTTASPSPSGAAPTILSQLQKAPITQSAAANFKSDLLRLIVDADLSFKIVERPAFRRLVNNALLPESSTTIKNWIEGQYDHHLQAIKRSLRSRLSRVHVSFDLWSSPAMQAYMSVVFYYVDAAG